MVKVPAVREEYQLSSPNVVSKHNTWHFVISSRIVLALFLGTPLGPCMMHSMREHDVYIRVATPENPGLQTFCPRLSLLEC